jgi:outer membrane protein assembly factor BamB
VWRFETDVDSSGHVLNNGCDGVWSSPTLDESRGLVSIGVSDCQSQGIPPYAERVIALHATTGAVAWVFTPPRLQGVAPGQDPACDFDFGATSNLGSNDSFLGIGGKDGTYYRLDPATGALVWKNNVVFGGSAGGFIGTTAYDGNRVYGATAFGDFGSTPCEPRNLGDMSFQEPSMHAFNANGHVAWQQEQSQGFGPTTVGGGMTFVGYGVTPEIQVRNAGNGLPVTVLPLPSSCFCGIAASGNGIYFGTGSPQQGVGDGIYADTPVGATPAG